MPRTKITDELTAKLGGRFKLSSLVQKRMQELTGGSRPLVEPRKGEALFDTVLREITENKIFLDDVEEQ